MISFNPIEAASHDYVIAVRGYASSSLAFYLEDAQRAASKLLRLGVSESTLNEIWSKYND